MLYKILKFIISERPAVFKGNFPDLSCLKGCRIVHGANGTTDIQSELRPCGNRTMKPHELTILGHTHTQKLARSIMTFSRIHLQDLHTLSRKKRHKKPLQVSSCKGFGGRNRTQKLRKESYKNVQYREHKY